MNHPEDRPELDRYVSFIRLECDAKAQTIVGGLRSR